MKEVQHSIIHAGMLGTQLVDAVGEVVGLRTSQRVAKLFEAIEANQALCARCGRKRRQPVDEGNRSILLTEENDLNVWQPTTSVELRKIAKSSQAVWYLGCPRATSHLFGTQRLAKVGDGAAQQRPWAASSLTSLRRPENLSGELVAPAAGIQWSDPRGSPHPPAGAPITYQAREARSNCRFPRCRRTDRSRRSGRPSR